MTSDRMCSLPVLLSVVSWLDAVMAKAEHQTPTLEPKHVRWRLAFGRAGCKKEVPYTSHPTMHAHPRPCQLVDSTSSAHVEDNGKRFRCLKSDVEEIRHCL